MLLEHINKCMANSGALSRQPDKLDYLNPSQFRFTINQLPKVEFFTTACNVPGVSVPNTEMATPFVNIPVVGEKTEFEDFTLSFIVDEYLENYLSLHDWITGLGFPDSRQQYKTFRDETADTSSLNTSKSSLTGDRSLYSDATLTILSNKNNPIVEIRFRDMFPISLDSLDFDQGATDANNISCGATFKYQQYKIIPL
mgnify:FL=1|jgi:hypothetical protein|tara:strand:- start:537 stop:1130 length:594 start_codon:yes stop_codon:yes gene_type:complete